MYILVFTFSFNCVQVSIRSKIPRKSLKYRQGLNEMFRCSCLLFILVATEEGVKSPSLTTTVVPSDDLHAINSSTTGDETADVHEPQASVSGGGADIRSSFEEIPAESEPATADSNVKDYVLSQNSAVSSNG